MPTDWHLVHLGSRATGGAGLIFTEMMCVSADARITPGCTGLYTDAQEAAWKRIVDFVHANSAAKFCLQLGHAGRKGATRLMWEGMDQPLARGRLAGHLGLAAALLSAQPGAARNDARRHGHGDRRFRAGGRARRARRLRHGGAALRARLSAGELHLAADQHAHRRIRRHRWKTACASRSKCSAPCARPGRTRSRCRCASRRPTGRRAASPATTRSRSRAPSRRPAAT